MNVVKTGVLLAAMTALFLVIGYALGGGTGALIALVVAFGTNLSAWWNSASMVLRMHNARAVSRASAPELVGMVEALAARAGLPMPQVYVIETDQPNAFATGRDPSNAAVAVTRGLVQTLDRDELAGVIAHELAHIRNRDTLIMTVAASIAGAIGFLAHLAQWQMMFGGGRGERSNPILGVIAILGMVLAPMAAMLVQLAISRTREYSADRLAAEITGDPMALASALRDIERIGASRVNPYAERAPEMAHLYITNPLRRGGLDSLFRTHPRTEDRIKALMAFAQERGLGTRPRAAATGQGRGPWG